MINILISGFRTDLPRLLVVWYCHYFFKISSDCGLEIK